MLFDRDELIEAIDELVARLVAAGAEAQIRVVGGAAVAINHERAMSTGDIDALYGRRPAVVEAVAAIADERNWPPTWLNDSVAAFVSHFDEHADWVTFRRVDGVSVPIAPADLLLAMKLLAGRGRRDGPDIEMLLDVCSVAIRGEAEAIFERYYPEDQMADGAVRLLDARFGR